MLYQNDQLKEISFPLGGIGSGCIGLAGNGRLIDWEIFNRPNKGSLNGYSHFAVKAKTADGIVTAKVLNGDLQKDLMGQFSNRSNGGYGFGADSTTMCGFPHFRECKFTGEFPIATIDLSDPEFPADVRLTAFNPLIPLDDKNSSLPAAFFDVRFTNTSTEQIEYTVAFSVMNPFECSKNTGIMGVFPALKLNNAGANPSELSYGDLTVACRDTAAAAQNYWYRGGWQDGIATFWREFSSQNQLMKRNYDSTGCKDMCSLECCVTILPGENKSVQFVLAWNVPNQHCYWNPLKNEANEDVTWKNYYATLFPDSTATATFALKNWDSLYKRTLQFKDALFGSTLDECVLDAISSTLSVIKSPTVLRLEDGSFYGWEGVNEQSGSCEGTCSHVWNYAYALCFLFPKLERSIRDLEFKYSTYENGEMDFRLKLPLGREKTKFRACVDGQMGSVIKAYREWKISGDDVWLKSNWAFLQKIIEYAWDDTNTDEWDKDKTGIISGRQHHTLDMELFGASSWLQGFYLAALKAGAEMALHLGLSAKHDEYLDLYQKGYEWTKENLFNGDYFIQNIDLKDKSIINHFNCADTYWNDEMQEIKYQIANGSEIDQLCGQWHANICGLGAIFDKTQIKTALQNMYRNNYKQSMRSFANPWRIFALNDDSATIICDYPNNTHKPAIPIPYCEESMHGFEYQLAGLLVSEGMVDEGLTLVQAIRRRYNGGNRNPWNEIECGGNYARSMASFALLPLFSGFLFDLPNKTIGFNPVIKSDNFKCLWSLDSGYGIVEINSDCVKITILEGNLSIEKIKLPFTASVAGVMLDGNAAVYTFSDSVLSFEEATLLSEIVVKL